jgi:WD40 repeat protein
LEGHSSMLCSVAFSPDSKLLASGDHDGTIKLWDTATGMLKHTLKGQGHRYYSVIFSPDGQHLASATHYGIELWYPDTGVLKGNLLRRYGIRSIAYSPEGRLLACGASHGIIMILNSVTGALEHTIQGHTLPMRARGRAVYRGSVDCVAYSPDGQLLASGSSDETIKLWDSATGALRHTLEVETFYSAAVFGIAFSHDGRTLASAHGDAGIMRWDPDLGALKYALKGSGAGQSVVAFSPCGQFLATLFQDGIGIWDIITSELTSVLEGHSNWVTSVAFSSDGQLLACGADNYTISVWDPAIYMPSSSQESRQNSVQSVVFSPDGRLLASSSELECTVKVWDPDTGTLKHTMKDPKDDTESPTPLVFSFDNQILAAGSGWGTVRLWDLTTGRLKHTLQVHRIMWQPKTDSIAFSYHGQLIASGSGDNIVDIWDLATGTHRHSLRGHRNRIKSIDFSPNGQMRASSSEDEIKLWDIITGALKHNLEDPMMAGLLAFSPDSQLLASAHRTQIKLWDPVTGALKQSLQHIPHRQFSKDFAYLATKIETLAANNWHGELLPGFLLSINKPSVQDNRWVTLWGERKLWLPSDYTPSCSTARDDAIAIGCGNGRVHIIIFSL